jgi:hypothetical protein
MKYNFVLVLCCLLMVRSILLSTVGLQASLFFIVVRISLISAIFCNLLSCVHDIIYTIIFVSFIRHCECQM